MQARKWDLDKDYLTLSKWCKERKWESDIPKEMLPPQGIIIEDEKPICASGLYLNEKVKFGYMYGIFSNPKTAKIKLFRAMKMCLQEIRKLAIEEKLELILTHTAEPSLSKLYTRHEGMQAGENNVKSYVMNLNKDKYKNLDWLS